MFLSSSFSFSWLSKLYLPNPVHAPEIKEKKIEGHPLKSFFPRRFLALFYHRCHPENLLYISSFLHSPLFRSYNIDARTRSICKVHLLASSSSSSSSSRHSDCWSVEKSKACRGLFRVLLYL